MNLSFLHLAAALGVLANANGAVVFLDTFQSSPSSGGITFGDNAPGYGLPEPQNVSVSLQFTPSEHAAAITVTLALSDFYGTSGLPHVAIYGNSESSGPGVLLGQQSPLNQSLPLSFDSPLILTIDAEVIPEWTYWIVLSAENGDKFLWMDSTASGPEVWASTNEGDWTATGFSAGQIRIESSNQSSSIPEPTGSLLAGTGLIALLVRRSRVK